VGGWGLALFPSQGDAELPRRGGHLNTPWFPLRDLFVVETLLLSNNVYTATAVSNILLPSGKNDPDQVSNL